MDSVRITKVQTHDRYSVLCFFSFLSSSIDLLGDLEADASNLIGRRESKWIAIWSRLEFEVELCWKLKGIRSSFTYSRRWTVNRRRSSWWKLFVIRTSTRTLREVFVYHRCSRIVRSGSRTTTSFRQRTFEHRSFHSLVCHRSDWADHEPLRHRHIDRTFQHSDSECSRTSWRMPKSPSAPTTGHPSTLLIHLGRKCSAEDRSEHRWVQTSSHSTPIRSEQTSVDSRSSSADPAERTSWTSIDQRPVGHRSAVERRTWRIGESMTSRIARSTFSRHSRPIWRRKLRPVLHKCRVCLNSLHRLSSIRWRRIYRNRIDSPSNRKWRQWEARTSRTSARRTSGTSPLFTMPFDGSARTSMRRRNFIPANAFAIGNEPNSFVSDSSVEWSKVFLILLNCPRRRSRRHRTHPIRSVCSSSSRESLKSNCNDRFLFFSRPISS